jgi:RNA polymerase primary sigma factor
MGTAQDRDVDELATSDGFLTRALDPKQERRLLGELAACNRRLAAAPAQVPGAAARSQDDPQDLSRSSARRGAGAGPAAAGLGAVWRRRCELRSRLALANFHLVAHVARRYRDRGINRADLIQEGFCGLLEAIDRFDLAHRTRLATYATWWIRQAMQRLVAAGAYPVRLSPRHLRQLCRNQDQLRRLDEVPRSGSPAAFAVTIRRIHAATRPALSLDAGSGSPLLQTAISPEGDNTGEVDKDVALARLMQSLSPREQRVLALRFGLGDLPRSSLSQVGKLLTLSKERVRQIQGRALEHLRTVAARGGRLDTPAPRG